MGVTEMKLFRQINYCTGKLATFTTAYNTKVASFCLILLFAMPSLAAEAQSNGEHKKILTLLTWEDYIDEQLISEFEQVHRVKVKQVHFDSDTDRNELLALYGVDNYDLIMVDETNVPTYQQLGWITPLNWNSSAEVKQLNASLPEYVENSKICSTYLWGTTGIAYRKDLVSEPITSWSQLFHPNESLQGKILMPSEANETVGMALKALGYPMFSTNKDELKQARDLLISQASSVKLYTSVAGEPETSLLVTGDIVALITYNSDALMLQEEEPNIAYTLPIEGGAIWIDFLCLSQHSRNPELARLFLHFINIAKNAAKNAQYLHGATPNQAAIQLLPEELRNDPLIFPGKKQLSNSEPYQLLPPRAQKYRNNIMTTLINLKL